jgi:D-3-phosphoglycerate dehydrogenase / 2-oxoglutarate reductase
MNKIYVLANDGISTAGAQAIADNGQFELDLNSIPQSDLAQYIQKNKVAALLVRSATKVRQDLMDACPSLQVVIRGGVGVDNIDVEYAKSKGIAVYNTPASSSQSVAELTFGMMFSMARGLYDADRNMPEKGVSDFNALKKKYGKGTELRGKTLGIVGFGRIGRSLAQYALGCGMNVLAFDPYASETQVTLSIAGNSVSVNVEKCSTLAELLPRCQYVSLHVPKQADGSAVMGAHELGLLPRGAMVVNCARGGVIDEDALLEALNSGQLSAAALDVFENEPTPREDLLKHPKIISTPHIGAATEEAQDRIGEEIASILNQHFGS